MPFWPARSALVAVPLAMLGTTGCAGAPSAHLTVDLAVPPRAVPLVFHGNCFVGYALETVLRVRETEGVSVVIESLAFRFQDEARVDGGGESLDAAALDDRYGPGTRALPAYGTTDFSLSWRFDAAGRSPTSAPTAVTISGEVAARDGSGQVVRAAYAVRSPVTVVPYLPEPGGACGLPP